MIISIFSLSVNIAIMSEESDDRGGTNNNAALVIIIVILAAVSISVTAVLIYVVMKQRWKKTRRYEL